MEREILREAAVGRENIANLLNEMDLIGEAVEVGTHIGQFADAFMRRWKGRVLHCVDPWDNPPGYEEQARCLVGLGEGGGKDREKDFASAVARLSRYGNRVNFHRHTSAEALSLFQPRSLDLVYLDGDHTYDHVHFDVWHWWEKVKFGGILAGHDLVCPHESKGGWGRFIQPVVFDFAIKNDLTINIVRERIADPWSYYFIKEKK